MDVRIQRRRAFVYMRQVYLCETNGKEKEHGERRLAIPIEFASSVLRNERTTGVAAVWAILPIYTQRRKCRVTVADPQNTRSVAGPLCEVGTSREGKGAETDPNGNSSLLQVR